MKKLLITLSLFFSLFYAEAQVPADTATLRSDISQWLSTNGYAGDFGTHLNWLFNGAMNLLPTAGGSGANVKYSDTAAMLSHYLLSTLGVKYTDTGTMLTPYTRSILDVKYTDTASMLSPYQRALTAVKQTDTASMLTPYLHKTDTTAMLSGYLRSPLGAKYSDTAAMLSTYAKTYSQTLTGVPAAPTAAVGTNTTQLATTAFAEALGHDADQFNIMKSLGSPALAISPGIVSIGESSVSMVSGTVFFAAIYLRTPQTITGVKCALNVQGSFTNNNYNGIGLYSVSGTTLTLVDSSTDDAGAGWKSAAGSTVTEAFASTYAAAAGTYFAAFLYNTSAQTTAPTLYSTAGGSGGQQGFTLTNSQKQNGSLTGQNTLPATTTGAALSGIGNVVAFIIY